jgi:hypothetical protein
VNQDPAPVYPYPQTPNPYMLQQAQTQTYPNAPSSMYPVYPVYPPVRQSAY